MLEQTDLSNVLVLDIETVPQYAEFAQVPAHFQELWDSKTRYQRREQTPEEFYERAGIWAEFGRIVCISVGIFTGAAPRGLRIKSFCCEEERDLLTDFSDLLKKQAPNLVLCAHNGK
ncbi:MAG: 3'-5' exonuclease, partial [Mucilaginibacter polytrichastri]|nr:3'-5' exonuclease [Mucilaginibacter polytrichastri]